MDLFDLSVCLTISATDGLDMVNEELLGKLAFYKNHCCLLHALNDIDPDTDQDFDPNLRSTLMTARIILGRISAQAQNFICICMQQRFTDKELKDLAAAGYQGENVVGEKTTNELLNHPWLASASGEFGQKKNEEEDIVQVSLQELLAVSSDRK